MIIGIDLGTTNSAVGYMTADGPRLIPNALGEVLTPSVVGFDPENHLLVGRAARELQVLHPGRCAAVFKRHMGSDRTIPVAGQVLNPVKLSSLVLSSLKQDAEKFLQQPVDRAVITVPAYFNEFQRQATQQAAQIAGLAVQRLVNEPTAAAMAYGLQAGSVEKTLVVVDLGGGTFDVTVLDLFDGTLEVRATAGEIFLGGEDFTNALCARVLEQAGLPFEKTEMAEPLRVARLRWDCEIAKRQLTQASSVVIRLPDALGHYPAMAREFTVQQAEFHAWTDRLLVQIEGPIRRALGDAGLKRQQVDEVILVGGATRMPMLRQRIREMFGREPHCRLNPDEVVALGAAVQGGLFEQNQAVQDFVVTDVAPFTMGVETCKSLSDDYQDGYFLPIISRNTTIPVSRVKRVHAIHPQQTAVSIKIYQGEGRRVEQNVFLGEFEVKIPRAPADQSVDIRFTYDLNGVLEVEATVMATQQVASLVITKHAVTLSKKEVQAAIAQMQALKVHPRDDAANRLLMLRAERIYQELPPHERDRLGQLLEQFEILMEERNAAAIEQFRTHVIEFLDRFDRESNQEWGTDDSE